MLTSYNMSVIRHLAVYILMKMKIYVSRDFTKTKIRVQMSVWSCALYFESSVSKILWIFELS